MPSAWSAKDERKYEHIKESVEEQGKSTAKAKEIAARLQLSPKTVDTYRASLMRKLDVQNVAGLVKFAIGRDLIAL